MQRIAWSVIVLLVTTVAVTGCLPEPDPVVPGSRLAVALPGPVTTLNTAVRTGASAGNTALAALVQGGFWRLDERGEYAEEPAFGRVRVESEDPLTVAYQVDPAVHWSDGVGVDGADLLLTWASQTTHRTGGPDVDGHPATWWDTGAAPDYGLDLVTDVPRIAVDGAGVTLRWDDYFADWRLAFDAPPVPAHTVVMLAYPDRYGQDDAQQAKDDFVRAVQDDDLDWLAPVSVAFRTGFGTENPARPAAPTSGAYLIDRVGEAGSVVELRANPDFHWGPPARIERITARAAEAQDAVTAAASGAVDLASTWASATAATAAAASGLGIAISPGTAFDHLDLQVGGGGVFDAAHYGGDEDAAAAARRAFLLTIPRSAIAERASSELGTEVSVRVDAVGVDAAGSADAAARPESSDLEAARGLLAEAGIGPAMVRVLLPAADPRRAAEFDAIAAAAADAGFTVVPVVSEDWRRIRSAEPESYDAALFAWDVIPAATVGLASVYLTGSVDNTYGWSEPAVDDLIAAAAAQRDAPAREQLLGELASAVSERAWTLPLIDVPVMTLWGDALSEPPPAPASPAALTAGFAGWMPRSESAPAAPTAVR